MLARKGVVDSGAVPRPPAAMADQLPAAPEDPLPKMPLPGLIAPPREPGLTGVMGRGGGALKGMMARSWSWGMEVLCVRAAREDMRRRERVVVNGSMLGVDVAVRRGDGGDY